MNTEEAKKECCDAKVEIVQDLTLYGEVGRIHSWIYRANEVLGIDKDDEAKAPQFELLSSRVEDCVIYLYNPLSVRLETILSELHRLKQLVG